MQFRTWKSIGPCLPMGPAKCKTLDIYADQIYLLYDYMIKQHAWWWWCIDWDHDTLHYISVSGPWIENLKDIWTIHRPRWCISNREVKRRSKVQSFKTARRLKFAAMATYSPPRITTAWVNSDPGLASNQHEKNAKRIWHHLAFGVWGSLIRWSKSHTVKPLHPLTLRAEPNTANTFDRGTCTSNRALANQRNLQCISTFLCTQYASMNNFYQQSHAFISIYKY